MMKEDLGEVLPLWSLDRRGDGPRGTAVTREAAGVLYAFGCTGPLGEPLEMVRDGPPRRVADRATTDGITPLAMIRRVLAVMRLRRARVRSRLQLKALDSHLLRDIGLGHEAVDYTSPRPELYWD
jgi:uncharacterized protein YjiS (DUF1127 family)